MIETVADIVEDLANKVGKYGAHEYEGDDCRVCFAIDLAARIKHAVEVEMKLGVWALLLAVTLSASPITHAPIAEQPLQYWHTRWVPTDNGVYPLEVYAPALPRVEPELYVFTDIGDPPRLVETPEPGTGRMISYLALVGLIAYLVYLLHQEQDVSERYRKALHHIADYGCHKYSREIARMEAPDAK